MGIRNKQTLFSTAMLLKVLEHIAYNRISNFLVDNEILYENQFGF